MEKDGKICLFNNSNLAWAVLEAEELAYLPIHTKEEVFIDDLFDRVPVSYHPALEGILISLYARGLILLNNEAYVGNYIFDEGVLYHHTYLIEFLLTEKCNIRCSYCFAEVDNRKKMMKEDTAKAILDKVLQLPTNRLMIEFSGGEVFLNFPTFQFCVEYLKAHKGNKEILLTAQTNAMLLNEKILTYCEENQIHLSLTLDGPQWIHDKQRIGWNGKGTYHKVIEAIELLQKKKMPFGMIGVITAHSVDYAREIMDHYKALGVRSVKLNHCTPQGYSREVWGDIGIDGHDYLKFLKEVYAWIKDHDGAVTESNLSVFFLNILSKTSQYRCTRTTCRAGSEFLVFDPNGDIFPCPRFKHNPLTRLGNIADVHETPVNELYKQNDLVRGIDERNVNRIPMCKDCTWRNACRGGCSLETFEAYHTLDRESGICQFYKGIYPFLFEKLLDDAEFIARHFLSDSTLVGIPFEETVASPVSG
ncbi:MAG: radical SAM protein [Saprospiraceae bacterium]|nr:radical SAM protein [Lewinella sp.]